MELQYPKCEKAKQCLLSESSEKHFSFILGHLTTERKKIFEAMVFAIKNSDSAFKVVEMIEEFSENQLGGLYVISDILYNCNKVDIEYSWSYLPLLESRLPLYLERFKSSAEALNVINVWETWGIFDGKYLKGLKSIVDEKPPQNSLLVIKYKEILNYCDDYFIKNKCKEFGQRTDGHKEQQISRICYFLNYIIATWAIKDDWVYVEVQSLGTKPENIIEKVDKIIDMLTGSGIQGEELDALSIQVIKKHLNKYPGVYICQHN